MADSMISGEMDDFLELYGMTVTSPSFKTTSLLDSYQEIDSSLIPTLWSSLPPPVAQNADYANKSDEKNTSSLGSKKRRRQETERNRQRRYRQRLRVEREMLENEVEKLSRELEQLKEAFRRRRAPISATVPSIESCMYSETLDEKEKRLLSERQLLQATVNMQAMYIEHLHKLVPGASLDTEEG
ncbi:hypothetical protein L917_12795 [Phytophthora nicotianae]|uniref:BZIP domain-containing protein n=3 Tax=Phytophthora nicotianae TaxID=4792 RepID=W2R543_PHYN3|nr:hypothetical protein PPTG_03381 [Phytophthora nicotianae INRA-310]ETL88104.1 hypothetical protein L917_12795 [Phytophthora nicotianae]ETN20356.1 hypothetical protein PPTG_03381 [Phytophthora nicotianae INRA-310]ETO70054.1 hypothetical protein F444_13442 [Phytophthora nicotianae P1976]